ncbi:hypothetical protein SAMN05216553_101462 [Lentzea fradiae]|uniref:Uncharacterized protein n=1 Tax=Lentzea fradiae TaxID=200378 RepID=A0A1G7KSS3_9PSEU|nr:hypothetical protein [Lentzea fradiae]SDF40308.1 hypothetical protein SAMN05216553_101462 [Lentzea fradiae]
MKLDWGYFRQLYEDVPEDVEGLRRYLGGRVPAVVDHLAELAPLRTRELVPVGGYTGDDEQLWRIMKLYALSRVSDFLIDMSSMDFPVHAEFFEAVGLTPFEHADAFSPFHHEIVDVVQDPSATSVTVEEVLRPGFWFGDLLFNRAGVRVRAPRHLVDATAATTSTLYFTFRRGTRRTDDLSHGWGSNSQWRTSFPRFYADADGLHLNWDGEADIGHDPPVPPADGLGDPPLDERRELVLHRCFVRGLPADEADRMPYGDRLSLLDARWPLPPESVTHVRWNR